MSDYNSVSDTYANTRWPLPWILNAISQKIRPHSNVLDLGCGTGDYSIPLVKKHLDCTFFGTDISIGMIRFASNRCQSGHWTLADLDRALPYKAESMHFAFSVNVMHHLANHQLLFRELNRVLKEDGGAVIFSDSEEDIQARSQSKYFPETLDFNLARYPKISYLTECAALAGLRLSAPKLLSGLIELDDKMIQVLEKKALSELRVLSDAGYEKGMEAIKKDRAQGMFWQTQITMLEFTKE